MILKYIAKKLLILDINKIPKELFPRHVLIIPDGNGRWAQRLHKDPSLGHQKGFEKIKKVLRELQNLPIDTLTIWGFSSDNWKRSSKEVSDLMKISENAINEALPELLERN